MTTQTRPRWDEFVLALFWLMAGVILLYFGSIGYITNLSDFTVLDHSLPRFIISFGLLCLAIFGLTYALRILTRLFTPSRGWLENFSLLVFGTVLLAGFGFSLFTLGMLIYILLADGHSRLVLSWGMITIACLVVLAVYQFLWSLQAFEPFLPWPDEFYNQIPVSKVALPMRLLLNLNRLQHSLINGPGKLGYALERMSGPLLTESDPKTTVALEQSDQRPALEKSMIAHGGWHANTLGFLSNGSVIFGVSDGGTVHYQAGGRRGMLFPPEIKLWDVPTDRVQTAALGQPYTFLTRKYQTPSLVQNYRFLVPTGGGKFALITPTLVRVGNWQDQQTKNYVPEVPIVLRGFGGFTPIAINPEGSKIAWCNAEGQTFLWGLEDGQMQSLRLYPTNGQAQTGQVEGVWGLVFSPDGTKIAMLGAHGVLLQNVYTGWRWFVAHNPQQEHMTAFSFNYNGFAMSVGLNLHPDAVRKSSSSRPYASVSSERSIAPAVTQKLVTSNETEPNWVNVLRLWDLRLSDYLDLPLETAPVREVVFSPDNQMLAAVDEAGILRLWDVPIEGLGGKAPRLVARLDVGMSGRKTVLNFAPDMQNLVCATDNRLLMYNLARLRREAAPHLI